MTIIHDRQASIRHDGAHHAPTLSRGVSAPGRSTLRSDEFERRDRSAAMSTRGPGHHPLDMNSGNAGGWPGPYQPEHSSYSTTGRNGGGGGRGGGGVGGYGPGLGFDRRMGDRRVSSSSLNGEGVRDDISHMVSAA